MHRLLVLVSAGLLMAQGLPDSVYIRLKEQGINPYASPPSPPGFPTPLNLPESDCSGAIRLCGATYSYPGGIPSAGLVSELSTNGRGTCLSGGEHRSVWFIFTIQSGGTLGFLICPNAATGNDYDFALWDVTGLQNPCSIFQGTGNVPSPIRCNFSMPNVTTCCGGINCSNNGLTGLDHTNPQPGSIFHGAIGPAVMPGLNVTAGQTFLLLVDNWSNNNVGFTITFYGTAQYFDNSPPRIDSVYRVCSDDYDTQLPALSRLRVRFNELILPSSVALDGSDFTLFDNTTNLPVPLTAATPLNPPQTNTVELTVGQPLVPNRSYTLYINYNDPNDPGAPTGGTNNIPIQDQCNVALPTTTVPPGAAADTFVFSVLDTMNIQVSLSIPSCIGTPTGQISAQVSGGLSPYQFVLVTGAASIPPTSGWSATSTWSNRSAGTYTVWIRDGMGCIQRRVVQLQDPPPLTLVLLDSLLIACGGQSSGFVVLQGQGGTPPYEYSVLPVAPAWTSNPSFTGLGVGTYTLRVRDSKGCVFSRTVSVTPGAAVSVQLQQIHQPILCNGGTGGFTVQASGGNGGSTFTYSIPSLGLTNTTGIFTGIPAGTYTVRATDSLGCSGTLTVTLPQPDPLMVVLVDSFLSSCDAFPAGRVTLQGQGGTPPYEYSVLPTYPTWTSNPTFTGLGVGSYTIQVRDANGCLVSRVVEVSPGAAVSVQLQQVTQPILCHGGLGSFTVQATSGNGGNVFTYTLQPLGITNTTGVFTDIPAGTYTVEAMDNLGCTGTATVNFPEPTPIAISDSAIRPASCPEAADGEIQLVVTGGTPPYTYTWRDSAGNILATSSNNVASGLRPGRYTVSLTDQNGCTYGPVSIEVPYANQVEIRALQVEPAAECPPPRAVRVRADIQGTPPFSYTWIWSDGVQNVSGQSVEERTFPDPQQINLSVRLVVTTAGGCTAESSTQVRLPACPGLAIPLAVTPNGDGINDFWAIQAPGFQRYTVVLYDRWGGEVWTNGGDMSRVWDGRNKDGQPLPEGVYIYLFVGVDGEGREVRKHGTVTLLR
ncbi:MAG: gliding motility-associated C-terminal domain-containing protein [Bacteroidia bacterium]|nr:gliding motility-associated C-terminal domain-containing protein [Bacteroidia bacterium]